MVEHVPVVEADDDDDDVMRLIECRLYNSLAIKSIFSLSSEKPTESRSESRFPP